MDKYLVLIAGPPATGKSYLVDILKNELSYSVALSPDEFKIDLANSEGFNNQSEKELQEKKVWELFYEAIDLYMRLGKKYIIIEYPFSDKQKDKLIKLTNQYDYKNITIRLVADFETLWQRRKIRDREFDRHLSLIMSHYKYGDVLENRDEADSLITKDEFEKIIEDRDYNNFELGQLFEVDVTDFSKVDYSTMIQYLKEI